MESLEAPCPPDGERSVEEREDIPAEAPPLDSTGVVPCPAHGMDHLTRDPSCEFCKKALGPLYRHLRGKYGTRLDDQTPTLSFDFSGPFPVSATGARFMLLFVWRLTDIRLFYPELIEYILLLVNPIPSSFLPLSSSFQTLSFELEDSNGSFVLVELT